MDGIPSYGVKWIVKPGLGMPREVRRQTVGPFECNAKMCYGLIVVFLELKDKNKQCVSLMKDESILLQLKTEHSCRIITHRQ